MNNYNLPRMDQLSCLSDKCNGIMIYRNYGMGDRRNGYYCQRCNRQDLDKDYADMDQRLDWQKNRIVVLKGGELL